MDTSLPSQMRNKIVGLGLLPVAILLVVFVLGLRRAPGGSFIAFVVLGLLGALVSAAATALVLRTVRTAWIDVHHSAEVRARWELQPTAPSTVDQDEPGGEHRDQSAMTADSHPGAATAGEQTKMAAVIGNLVRRLHVMLDRQIDLVDELESREEDPVYLEKLFKIDHLANRMRRNADGLLVLAGAEVEPRLGGPVPILDVLRVALGEVEEYDRVDLLGSDDAFVASSAALALAHMAAELIENAIDFSPPESMVRILGQHDTLVDGSNRYEILIADEGIGFSSDQLAEANRQLRQPDDLSQLSGHAIGLSVVGRLARTLGVTVSLTNNPDRGVSVLISVPGGVLADPGRSAIGVTSVKGTDDGLTVGPGIDGDLEAGLERNQSVNVSSSVAELPVLERWVPEINSNPVDADRHPKGGSGGVVNPAFDFRYPPMPDESLTRHQAPSERSRRQPIEIEQMMRRYRLGQRGTHPAANGEGVDDEY